VNCSIHHMPRCSTPGVREFSSVQRAQWISTLWMVVLAMLVVQGCSSEPGRDASTPSSDASEVGATDSSTSPDLGVIDAGLDVLTPDVTLSPDHPTPVDTQPDATVPVDPDATTPTMDATSAIDSTVPACGTQFVSFSFHHPGTTSVGTCYPLPEGIAANGMNCMIRDISNSVDGNPTVYVGGDADMFAAVGDTVFGIALRGPAVCPPGPSDGFGCYFRTRGNTCRGTVVHAGGWRDVVEVVLREPCRLVREDPQGNILSDVTVDDLRMRGRLRLARDISDLPDGAVPFADCGVL